MAENVPSTDKDSILYSREFVQQQRNGVFLLIDPTAPSWMSTNALGSIIVRRCDGHQTLGEIAESLYTQCGLTIDSIKNFINLTAQAGFISAAPDLAPVYPGRVKAIAPGRLEELWITTNNSCPLHCKHCLVDGGKEPIDPLSTGEILKLVDDALSLGVIRIYFTGGEPFLRQDLFALVEYITVRTQLVVLTSGILLSPDKAARLKELSHGNLIMQVSLEGPDAETNDAIRGEGNFDRAVQGIKTLINAGITPIVTTTLTHLNYKKAAGTTRFLAAIGVRDHHILWLHNRGRTRESVAELLIPGETVSGVMRELRQAAKETGIKVDNNESISARVNGKRGHKHDLCNAGFSMLCVNTDGHVFPCAGISGTPDFDCGSIKEKSLKEIWLSSAAGNWIREDSVQKREGCNSCFFKFFCGGGCVAQSYFNYEMSHGTGCIMAADPYCEAYKSQIMDSLWEAAMPEPAEISNSQPVIYRHMGDKLPGCGADGNNVLDAAFDVGTYHCSCVLAMDVKESD